MVSEYLTSWIYSDFLPDTSDWKYTITSKVYRGISATIIVDPAEKTVSQIKDRDALEAWLTGTTASPQPESFEDPADLLLKVKQMLEQSTKLQEDAMQLLEEQINSSKQ